MTRIKSLSIYIVYIFLRAIASLFVFHLLLTRVSVNTIVTLATIIAVYWISFLSSFKLSYWLSSLSITMYITLCVNEKIRELNSSYKYLINRDSYYLYYYRLYYSRRSFFFFYFFSSFSPSLGGLRWWEEVIRSLKE